MGNALFSVLAFSFIFFGASCNHEPSTYSKRKEREQKEKNSLSHSTGFNKDADFAVAAADGGMLEITLGNLAQQNGSSVEVKDLGVNMVVHHGKANQELAALAATKNIELPQTLSDKNQRKVDELSKKKGPEFDKAYVNCMVDDHKVEIGEFKKEADYGNDNDLVNWTKAKIPVLEYHLELAKTARCVVNNKH